ncbi:unnamed protein product [Phytophthora fragariaefolia]|uniref:B9 domain-containing protein 1 n=1 Tax=Phytophthora fragariaefolia TaxID=1490495 RepID=A0A9W6X7S7_9STRA|nr:unnamed protein product [Phytophthora fragariaefolia]
MAELSGAAGGDAVAKALERLRLRKSGGLSTGGQADAAAAAAPLPTAMPAAQPAAGFQVICSGQVESVHVRAWSCFVSLRTWRGMNLQSWCVVGWPIVPRSDQCVLPIYHYLRRGLARATRTSSADFFLRAPDSLQCVVLQGAENGLSQIAYLASHEDEILLNFPIDVSFKSTNPFGWPRLVLSLYGLDALGRDVVRGYGSVVFPVLPGCAVREVPLFRPQSSSVMQQFVAWLTGTPPEYFDSKFVAQSDSREVTRVTSAGKVRVVLNVATHGMKQHGYTY